MRTCSITILTICSLTYHVMLAAGSEGGDVQFARMWSPPMYVILSDVTLGFSSGGSVKKN